MPDADQFDSLRPRSPHHLYVISAIFARGDARLMTAWEHAFLESLKGYRRLSPRQMEVLSRSTRRRWSRGRGRRAPGGGRGGDHGGEPAGTQPPGHPRCADQ
jgi:hypothetical protein